MLTYADGRSHALWLLKQDAKARNHLKRISKMQYNSEEAEEMEQVGWYKRTNTDAACGAKAQILTQPALPVVSPPRRGLHREQQKRPCPGAVPQVPHPQQVVRKGVGVPGAYLREGGLVCRRCPGAKFCFTGTKLQIVTPEELRARCTRWRGSLTTTATQVLNLLALLVLY